MGFAIRADLGAWVSGLIVLQDEFNSDEFAELITAHVSKKAQNVFLETYENHREVDCGGICAVHAHPLPWLVVIFDPDTDWYWTAKTAVHEFGHLGDLLPTVSNGVKSDATNTEMRAMITEQAFDVFHRTFLPIYQDHFGGEIPAPDTSVSYITSTDANDMEESEQEECNEVVSHHKPWSIAFFGLVVACLILLSPIIFHAHA